MTSPYSSSCDPLCEGILQDMICPVSPHSHFKVKSVSTSHGISLRSKKYKPSSFWTYYRIFIWIPNSPSSHPRSLSHIPNRISYSELRRSFPHLRLYLHKFRIWSRQPIQTWSFVLDSVTKIPILLRE